MPTIILTCLLIIMCFVYFFLDMSDLLEDADEVNEIMGRAYGSDTE